MPHSAHSCKSQSGVRKNIFSLRRALSSVRCSTFMMKIPSRSDKTAGTAASLQISLAWISSYRSTWSFSAYSSHFLLSSHKRTPNGFKLEILTIQAQCKVTCMYRGTAIFQFWLINNFLGNHFKCKTRMSTEPLKSCKIIYLLSCAHKVIFSCTHVIILRTQDNYKIQ